MKKRHFLLRLIPALALPRVLYAETYLTSEQAAAQLLAGQKLTPANITLTAAQKDAIAKASGVRVRSLDVKAWRGSGGGWLIVDNVIGKHEFIDFALALDAQGAVQGVEILTYRETYGGEVRQEKWRAQFKNKTAASPLKIDADIKNISGATLSSVHLTEGVRRLVHTWSIALKP